MTTDDYRRALDKAVREYEDLGEQRRDIDKRMAQLAQTIGTLNRLCGFTPNVFWGLTDACRVVLKGAGHPMAPMEVRDRLEAIGFDLSRYSSSLAAIHTVLKRLSEAHEVRFVELQSGKVAYEWQQAPKALAVSEAALADLESHGPSRANKRRKK
jgi:uncharacterized protein YhaN